VTDLREDVVDDPAPRVDSEYFCYALYHIHDLDHVYRDGKFLGVFSSLAGARAAIRVALEIPGFRDAPEGFEIIPVACAVELRAGLTIWLVMRTRENEDLEDVEFDILAAHLDEREAERAKAGLEAEQQPRPREEYWATPYLVDEQEWMHGYVTVRSDNDAPGRAGSDIPAWAF
jgi:hypothetical protein